MNDHFISQIYDEYDLEVRDPLVTAQNRAQRPTCQIVKLRQEMPYRRNFQRPKRGPFGIPILLPTTWMIFKRLSEFDIQNKNTAPSQN